MGLDHVDGFEFQGIKDEDVTAGRGYVSSAGRSVGRRGKGGGNGFLGEGIGEVTVFRRRGESTDSMRVGGCFDGG